MTALLNTLRTLLGGLMFAATIYLILGGGSVLLGGGW